MGSYVKYKDLNAKITIKKPRTGIGQGFYTVSIGLLLLLYVYQVDIKKEHRISWNIIILIAAISK